MIKSHKIQEPAQHINTYIQLIHNHHLINNLRQHYQIYI